MAIGTSCQSHGSAPPPFLKVSSLLTEGSRWSFEGWGISLCACPALACYCYRNAWRKEVKFGCRSEFPFSLRKACVDESHPDFKFLACKCQVSLALLDGGLLSGCRTGNDPGHPKGWQWWLP